MQARYFAFRHRQAQNTDFSWGALEPPEIGIPSRSLLTTPMENSALRFPLEEEIV
jgi:hypothetical protein